MSELSVGQTVAEARQRAGLTVAEVAEASRIRATLVTHIEQDDFSLCGGDVYARGHLRTIAGIVGLDPAELVAQFDAERGRVRASATPVAPVPQPTRVTESGSRLGGLAGTLGATVGTVRQGPNWSAVMALALVVVLGIGVVSWLSGRSADPGTVAGPSGSATPTTSPDPSTPTPTPTPTASPTPSPTDAVASADGVRVVLAVTGNASWISATAGTSGKTLFEGTLTEGDSRTFKDDDEVSLIIGNAGAVELRVNGSDLGSPGRNGEVVRLAFGPGDPDSQSG